MPRGTKKKQRTPDSGCQFVCQYCEGDIYQVPYPELLFLLEMVRGEQISTAFQCCEDCAVEIKELNADFIKKHKPATKQERPLREGSELPPDLQAAKEELAAKTSSDAKIDKLIEAISGMVQLLSGRGMGSEAIANALLTPSASERQAVVAIRATIPQPKRKILAPPVKTSAKSKAKKPAKPVAKAAAKPKPRRK